MDSIATESSTPGGITDRIVSYIIDSVLIIAVIFPITALAGWPTFFDLLGTEGTEKLGQDTFYTAGLTFLFTVLCQAAMESSKWQATPGKRFMGLIVTTMDGRRIGFLKAAFRSIFKSLTVTFIPILLIVIALNKRRRAVHDVITETRVYSLKSLSASA